MPSKITLSDSDAKKAFRETWPIYRAGWLGTPHELMRILPFPIITKTGPRQPYLQRPGGGRVTNPDGLYASFIEQSVDLLVLEHCGTEQNLNDKRSRYAHARDGSILAIPKQWRSNWEFLIHGGPGGKYIKPDDLIAQITASPFNPVLLPWEGRSIYSKSNANLDWKFPVRSLICIYFVSPKTLAAIKSSGMTFSAHEFVTVHSKIKQINHADMRDWLRSVLSLKHIF
jgi:hypothetical protein